LYNETTSVRTAQAGVSNPCSRRVCSDQTASSSACALRIYNRPPLPAVMIYVVTLEIQVKRMYILPRAFALNADRQ